MCMSLVLHRYMKLFGCSPFTYILIQCWISTLLSSMLSSQLWSSYLVRWNWFLRAGHQKLGPVFFVYSPRAINGIGFISFEVENVLFLQFFQCGLLIRIPFLSPLQFGELPNIRIELSLVLCLVATWLQFWFLQLSLTLVLHH
jgi:hypothetical protein